MRRFFDQSGVIKSGLLEDNRYAVEFDEEFEGSDEVLHNCIKDHFGKREIILVPSGRGYFVPEKALFKVV